MKTTWDDSNEKVATFCSAHIDKDDEQEDKVILESLFYDDLFKIVEEMQLDFKKKLGSKYVVLQKIY